MNSVLIWKGKEKSSSKLFWEATNLTHTPFSWHSIEKEQGFLTNMTRRDAVGIGGRNCSSIPSNEYRTTHLLGPNRFAASVFGPFRLNLDPFPNSYPGGERRRRGGGRGGTAALPNTGAVVKWWGPISTALGRTMNWVQKRGSTTVSQQIMGAVGGVVLIETWSNFGTFFLFLFWFVKKWHSKGRVPCVP